ncbi:MAG: IPT/TIG domain-containing protein, partial [Methanospirillum sp.]|uniref:IPT/TIG domain-containing protein n=1 Tax=Methanospirillum sp. TaxID=45200 RepID=UPI00236BB820
MKEAAMEKRDILIIIAAIFIVLLMAMYVKPLVTGKPVQLIPDELSNFLKGDKQNQTANNTSFNNTSYKTITKMPAVTSISPQNLSDDGNKTSVMIQGRNFTESMNNVTFVNEGVNKTFPSTLTNGTLTATNVSLSPGNWAIKIVDNDTEVTYNTTRSIVVLPTITPEPTWDGKPVPLQATEKPAGTIFKSRQYPEDVTPNNTKMKTFSNFGGVRSVYTEPLFIPYNYWDLSYNVDFRTEIANPKDTSNNVFEFNKQYKEPLTTYEGEPIIYYEGNSSIPTMISVKDAVESETVFKRSSDTVLIKTPNDERDASPSYDTSTENAPPSLVESVGYMKPDIRITVKNVDDPSSQPITITPNGGIDPLQWDEVKHKTEAENILKQQGKQNYFDSEEYQDAWD